MNGGADRKDGVLVSDPDNGIDRMAERAVVPQETKCHLALHSIWKCVDWGARLVLVVIVSWGTWQTLSGVNLLLQDSKLPSRHLAALQELRARQTMGAIDNWTVSGSWEFMRPGSTEAAEQAHQTPLVTMPADARLIARRRGDDGQILLEFYTTTTEWTGLEAHWKLAAWEISPLSVNDKGEIPGYHLYRDSEAILVWSVSQSLTAGLRHTIACSRTSGR